MKDNQISFKNIQNLIHCMKSQMILVKVKKLNRIEYNFNIFLIYRDCQIEKSQKFNILLHIVNIYILKYGVTEGPGHEPKSQKLNFSETRCKIWGSSH